MLGHEIKTRRIAQECTFDSKYLGDSGRRANGTNTYNKFLCSMNILTGFGPHNTQSVFSRTFMIAYCACFLFVCCPVSLRPIELPPEKLTAHNLAVRHLLDFLPALFVPLLMARTFPRCHQVRMSHDPLSDTTVYQRFLESLTCL